MNPVIKPGRRRHRHPGEPHITTSTTLQTLGLMIKKEHFYRTVQVLSVIHTAQHRGVGKHTINKNVNSPSMGWDQATTQNVEEPFPCSLSTGPSEGLDDPWVSLMMVVEVEVEEVEVGNWMVKKSIMDWIG